MRTLIQHRFRAALAAVALVASAGSCASAERAEAPGTVRVFKYADTVQCSAAGADLPAMQRELTNQGVKVISSACGMDKRMRVAMCGAGDGRIALFEISRNDAEAASKIGFAEVSKAPDFQEAPCR